MCLTSRKEKIINIPTGDVKSEKIKTKTTGRKNALLRFESFSLFEIVNKSNIHLIVEIKKTI